VARADEGVEVVLVKRAGVTAYEEVSEEFGEYCRVHLRVVTFGDEGITPELARLHQGQIVVTVGQEALDAVARSGLRVIPTMAFATPANLTGPPMAPQPDLMVRMLQTARPSVRSVASVYGPRSESQFRAAQRAAERAGVRLVGMRATGGPEAVRRLHALVDDARLGVQAIWLPADTDIITPQVFRYALTLQLERGLPVVAATRQQVHAGALLAVDFSPRSAGRAAAELVNRILEGDTERKTEVELRGGVRVTVNGLIARRLGADVISLSRMGASVE
jgi:ABC-type uncharacterized transport system substrate-binding protein